MSAPEIRTLWHRKPWVVVVEPSRGRGAVRRGGSDPGRGTSVRPGLVKIRARQDRGRSEQEGLDFEELLEAVDA
jgi:hypothetical protein